MCRNHFLEKIAVFVTRYTKRRFRVNYLDLVVWKWLMFIKLYLAFYKEKVTEKGINLVSLQHNTGKCWIWNDSKSIIHFLASLIHHTDCMTAKICDSHLLLQKDFKAALQWKSSFLVVFFSRWRIFIKKINNKTAFLGISLFKIIVNPEPMKKKRFLKKGTHSWHRKYACLVKNWWFLALAKKI